MSEDGFEPSWTLRFRAPDEIVGIGNVFDAVTPFGRPIGISIGDVLSYESIFRDALEEIAEGDKWSDAGAMARIAQTALDKVSAELKRELHHKPRRTAPPRPTESA